MGSPTNLDLTVYTDADLARNLAIRRSVYSMIIELNDTVVSQCTIHQYIYTNYTNIAENLAIFKGVKKTLEARRFMESNGNCVNYSTPILEDNIVTITQIKND